MSAYEYERQRADTAEAERDEWKARYAELNGALCWDTTCLNCANLLDKSYADYARADRAERGLLALRAELDLLAMKWEAVDYRGPKPAEHHCAAELRTLLDLR